MLSNIDLISEATGRPLAVNSLPSLMISLSVELGLSRPNDLFRACGTSVTGAGLSLFRRSFNQSRVFGIEACSAIFTHVSSLLESLRIYPIGPVKRPNIYVFHCWRLVL